MKHLQLSRKIQWVLLGTALFWQTACKNQETEGVKAEEKGKGRASWQDKSNKKSRSAYPFKSKKESVSKHNLDYHTDNNQAELTDEMIDSIHIGKYFSSIGGASKHKEYLQGWLRAIKASGTIGSKRILPDHLSYTDTDSGVSVLEYAIYLNAATPTLLQALVGLGADVKSRVNFTEYNRIHHFSMLGWAVHHQAPPDVLEALVKIGAPINAMESVSPPTSLPQHHELSILGLAIYEISGIWSRSSDEKEYYYKAIQKLVSLNANINEIQGVHHEFQKHYFELSILGLAVMRNVTDLEKLLELLGKDSVDTKQKIAYDGKTASLSMLGLGLAVGSKFAILREVVKLGIDNLKAKQEVRHRDGKTDDMSLGRWAHEWGDADKYYGRQKNMSRYINLLANF